MRNFRFNILRQRTYRYNKGQQRTSSIITNNNNNNYKKEEQKKKIKNKIQNDTSIHTVKLHQLLVMYGRFTKKTFSLELNI